MTTSELVSWKTIDLVFEVGTFLRWMLATLQAFPAAHVLIEDDLKYAANDPQYAEQRGRLVDCNAKATHRCRNCKTVEFFPAPVQTIAILRDATWTAMGSSTTRSSRRWFSGVGRGKKLSWGRNKNRQEVKSKNHILVHLDYDYGPSYLIHELPCSCCRPRWKGDESPLGKRRRRCQRTKRRKRRRKRAQRRRNKHAGPYFAAHSTRNAVILIKAEWKKKNLDKKSNWLKRFPILVKLPKLD